MQRKIHLPIMFLYETLRI